MSITKRHLIINTMLLCIICIGTGCNIGEQVKTPIEYTRFSDPTITQTEIDELVHFLYDAEESIQRPLEATEDIEGIAVFSAEFRTKNDLYEYFQAWLSNELSDTLARKMSDLSLSRDGEYLVAVKGIDYPSIFDAEYESIKVIQHTTVQSVVEMDVIDNGEIYRLQYTIMKNYLGEEMKIVQKTYIAR